MNLSNLSFAGLPPIDVPFRYFIVAPVFVIAMAILVLFYGEELWTDRWESSILALTHGFTLGFIASIMMGALFQLLPVVGGISFAKPRLIATICHSLHTLGTISLIVGFLSNNTTFQVIAVIFLGVGFIIYLSCIIRLLLKNSLKNETLHGIKLAILALIATITLGTLIQSKIIGFEFINWDKSLINLHATWGLAGWVGLLIIAISFQIIPMFHVAPNFPKIVKKYLLKGILICLLALSAVRHYHYANQFILLIILLLNCLFAVSLLLTLNKRKRKVPDTTVSYWQLAATSMLIITLVYSIPNEFFPEIIQKKLTLLLSASFIFFYVVSILQGMLLKILPFLSFTHLQQRCLINFSALQVLPNMHDLLNKKQGKTLFIMHLITGFSLLVTIVQPKFYWLFGTLLLVEFSWLLFLISKTLRKYYLSNQAISQILLAKK